MLGELIGLAILGGAGYVGWRLAKGGSHLKLNPAQPLHEKMSGRPKGGYRITTLRPSFLVATFQQAEELVHELQPVLEELYPDGDVTGYTHSYGDFPFQTEEEMRKVSLESGPMKMVTKHTAHFGIRVDLETYEEMRDEMDTIMEVAQSLVDFPLSYDVSYMGAGQWSESKPKKKASRRR